MTKNTTLAAILCVAATMTAAQAEYTTCAANESGWNPYSSLGGGYLLDSEEPYFLLQLGMASECDTRVYLQLLYADKDESVLGFSVDQEVLALSLGASGSKYYDSKNSIYFGGSVGVAMHDISVSGVGSADDEMLYLDVTAGFRHDFTENFSGQIGVRYLYKDDFEYQGVTVAESGDDFGIELGFTVKF